MAGRPKLSCELAAVFCIAVVMIASSQPALAASHEQIVEACRQAHMEELRTCVRGKVGNPRTAIGPELEKARQACGAVFVRPCVLREEQKQAAGVAAPAAPKDEAARADAPIEIRASFVAPPRTIADITAVLDGEKPDEAQITKRKALADSSPAKDLAGPALAQFLFDRAGARALLARNKDALADALQALELGKRGGMDVRFLARTRRLVANQYRATGDPKSAIAILQVQIGEGDVPGRRGTIISSLRFLAQVLVSIGDFNAANGYVGRAEAMVSEARGSPNPKWRASYPVYGHGWEADASAARGLLFESRGQYADAEATYRRAEAFERAVLKDLARYDPPVPPREQVLQSADSYLLSVARNEMKQSKLSAAEADARRALLGILKAQGKYNPTAPHYIVGLAGILVEQGRYKEAEHLGRSALEVQRTIGIADEAPLSASILSSLGNILVLQQKMKEAVEIYAQLDKAMAQWPAQQREVFELNGSRIAALYASGQVEAGIAAATALLKQQASRTGANSFDTAAARGTLASGYARAGRDGDAIREFKAAIPILMGPRENAEDDDPTVVAARSARLQRAIESYIGVLARGAASSNTKSNDVAVETFGLADAIRGRSVQKALADSSARMVAKDPALAALVRNEQNLGKQIGAALGTLNNLLALPSDQRDEQTVRATSAAIDKLRADRKTAQQDIKRRFPSYADLIDPKPPTVDEIRNALRPGETLLSYYFGQNASFVWAVPKDGDVAFASVAGNAVELAAKVRRLRQALEPQATMVSEIPGFDLGLAYELYTALLKPVEPAWRPAKSLIVVTNGALGELPLSLLPTAPAQVDVAAKPLFSGYRNVAWLARSHAVTIVPSASAMVTLRRLPRGSPARDKFIGFGDPYFNADEAAEGESEQAAPVQVAAAAGGDAENVTRGMPLRLRAAPRTEEADAATLAMLPRLPDTRYELISVAKALDADPAKALYLGKAANEQNVETLDLAHYRIVAFSTHGLVPGDLDGLTQPALALTAPDIAGVKGDGLLTMEKILALKLDADWVVLSACNTAAGAGAGAEAASGLGSAFFYAGTRALLVTNWSVHSASARDLITDLFRRQRADAALSRSEALRQAMMAVLDGAGATDPSGQTIYSYAHPLFWAPYSLIGDGGGM
jgi:CHAT domain-containing protein/tetratricopeptide (TPR) repeat protein